MKTLKKQKDIIMENENAPEYNGGELDKGFFASLIALGGLFFILVAVIMLDGWLGR